jgi:hypothetical protein
VQLERFAVPLENSTYFILLANLVHKDCEAARPERARFEAVSSSKAFSFAR